ncbi:hypothetical protein DPMN_109423 [Dreissena polymorpha]|uniref:Uncharacterized protein n=1 Tax=Dreissena polymorpha TaxID=45954 RepID=A0A9D4QM54_DREPO|nr:hypothetical protein DPMN_109423 [Dreissena polymorpha]
MNINFIVSRTVLKFPQRRFVNKGTCIFLITESRPTYGYLVSLKETMRIGRSDTVHGDLLAQALVNIHGTEECNRLKQGTRGFTGNKELYIFVG